MIVAGRGQLTSKQIVWYRIWDAECSHSSEHRVPQPYYTDMFIGWWNSMHPMDRWHRCFKDTNTKIQQLGVPIVAMVDPTTG
jgi:hypothetical protein